MHSQINAHRFSPRSLTKALVAEILGDQPSGLLPVRCESPGEATLSAQIAPEHRRGLAQAVRIRQQEILKDCSDMLEDILNRRLPAKS